MNEIAVVELIKMKANYNPRRISEEDMKYLRLSLKTFGCVEPVVINKRFNRIVGGHQRVQAAEDIGMKSMPVIHVDLGEEKEKALNIALNRVSGVWDDAKLVLILEELDVELLPLTGFLDEELEMLLNGWSSDFDDIDKNYGNNNSSENSNLDGITARIVIECPQEDSESVRLSVLSSIESLKSSGGCSTGVRVV